ncbi:MAG: serine/threonine protein kinase [Elusimicrobia bacterium]|nr:serine/threonine protein kinase [Elusimicrobiota bacterium]
MGEVFEAMDKTLVRRVALKRLRPELLQDPAELERLLAEARVMAALKHPNMVAIYGAERHAGEVYLALEFVDGGTLEDRLARERRLPWAEALRVLEGAGAAVDHAHSRRVIHRDIKPANIMLSSKGEVKVADFGIAYQAAKSVSRLTRAPSWGTPPYMAPEQELGGLSAAVDRYALAVCLYEALTGELPFKGPNFLAQKREGAWEPPSRLLPELPRGVDDLFAIALAPEPARRFPTAAALTSACRALQKS